MSTILFDSFSGGTLDTNKWDVFTGTGSVVQNDRLEITGQGAWDTNGVVSKRTFTRGLDAGVRFKVIVPTGSSHVAVTFQKSNVDLSYAKFYVDDFSVYGVSGVWYRVVNGAYDTLGVFYSPDVEIEIFIKFLNNDGWEVYIDGNLVGTFTGTVNAAYYVAMQCYQTPMYFTRVSYDDVPPPPPIITTHPLSDTIIRGETGSFGVGVTGSDTINWYSMIGGVTGTFGTTGPNLYIPNAQATDQGDYRATAENGGGTVTSDPASLTVNWGPDIVLQPTGLTVLSGNPFTLTAGATGQPAVTGMTWWRVGDGQVGVGTSYTVASATESDEAGYYAIASNGVGPDATSDTAFVYVSTTASITQQPQSILTTLSQNVTFTVVAVTDPSYSTLYQWNKNGTSVSGATGASYVINDAQSTDLASYNVVITNGPVTLISNQAVLALRSADNDSPLDTIGTPGYNGNNAPGGGGGRGAQMGSADGDRVNNEESKNHVHGEYLVQKEGARLGESFRYPDGRSSRQEY